MTHKSQIELAKDAARIQKIMRRAKIAHLNDYIGFLSAKFIGTLLIILGALEWLDPTRLDIVISNPGAVAGAGAALLTGPKIANALARLTRDGE